MTFPQGWTYDEYLRRIAAADAKAEKGEIPYPFGMVALLKESLNTSDIVELNASKHVVRTLPVNPYHLIS